MSMAGCQLGQSPHFQGRIGQAVPAASFPSHNYTIADGQYDYEGNWAFCRFDNEKVMAARVGFGRGKFDWSDYGVTSPIDHSFLMPHIELMTSQGAVLWIGTGKFQAGQVRLATDTLGAELVTDQGRIFELTGWPHTDWKFESDDHEVAVDLETELRDVTILPDCVLRHNRFAMWLAVGRTTGTVRYGEETARVDGTMFFDHPRIRIEPHEVPPFGWFLYMPVRLADGAFLAAYYSEDGNGQRVDGYSFGFHVDAEGRSMWLGATVLSDLSFDDDNKPHTWQAEWRTDGVTVRARFAVQPTGIRRAWGAGSVPQTRRDNPNIPLVFDCELTIQEGAGENVVAGAGLAEYVAVAGQVQEGWV